jgi:GntR family transcriptional repressor for pyruvate dehydrogenase complex
MGAKPSIFQQEAPIARQSLAEMVAKRILEMVTSRALRPGDQLPPERELAEMLDVSRPSVREAIRGLAILGVVNVRQGGGAFISQLDGDALLGPIRFFLSLEDLNLRELYDARSLIEGDVARRAAQNMSDDDIDALETMLDAQVETLSDPQAFRVADLRFHEAIWVGCGNAFLKRIGERLNSLGLEFRRRASENPSLLEQSLKDHRKLFEALKARDPAAAAMAAEAHMQNVYRSTVVQDTSGEET